MCHFTTTAPHPHWLRFPLALLVVSAVFGQPSTQRSELASGPIEWREIGSTTFEASLPASASGPVDRVWYSADGGRLYIRTGSGRVLMSNDFESWKRVRGVEAPVLRDSGGAVVAGPEAGSREYPAPTRPSVVYALGRDVHRSDDGGLNWNNLTKYRHRSILGGGLKDLAVSPNDSDEISVGGRFGVWRSKDGGKSWAGLNDALPNLPVRRILRLPGNGRGVTVLLDGDGVFEWRPGEKSVWRPSFSRNLAAESGLRQALSGILGAPIGAVAAAGDYVYAGGANGRLWSSADGGLTWRPAALDRAGAVERIFVVPGHPRIALASIGQGSGGARVARTTNGGIFWDDLSSNLPDVAAHAVTADFESGVVYAATDAGLFFTRADLGASGPPTDWVPATAGFTDSPVYDVRLDAGANQLYIAVEGRGVFATMAPHRRLVPSVVNAGDFSRRPASPGVLLTILGRSVQTARAGNLDAPILARGDESQIQVPFEVSGSRVPLALTMRGGRGEERVLIGLPLRPAAPAIFVDHDGAPMVLDADSGVFLNAMRPARPGTRVQILATGLGRVTPPWQTGLPAPLQNPPEVVAPVRVFLDRTAIVPVRSTLAPGYIGFYVVEFEVPPIVNAGPAELYIEAGGEASNRTRIYLEP